MEYRYAVFVGWAGPEIFKLPIQQTARFRLEYSDRNPRIFYTLRAAKAEALSIVEHDATNASRTLSFFATASVQDHLDQRRKIAELTEDTVERFNC